MRKSNLFIKKYSTIYHISSNLRLRSNCLKVGFVVYNDKLLIRKRESIPPIPDYMIPVDLFQKNKCVINFTNNDMRSKFEMFLKNNMDALYLT